MNRKVFVLTAVILSTLSLASCKENTDDVEVFEPEMSEGNQAFDFDSNSFEPDVKLDGYLDEERWLKDDVISLGSFDDSDIESGEYGAIINDRHDYKNSKRAIIKMFKGNIGYHFGFEVHDTDVCYKTTDDGDDAIYTDNVLLNICTRIDGSEIPMNDDFYFLVTAFNSSCLRRGANAAGMWGGFTGIIDFQSSIHKDDKGNVTGFGTEIIVPYGEIGVTRDEVIAVTFRSSDRISSSKQVIEREWYFKDSYPFFNTPNSYIIWGTDNNLYSYYDYKMPDVSIKGSLLDKVTNTSLKNIKINGETTSDEKGNFVIDNVNSNSDLVLNFSGDGIFENQKYVIDKNIMRAAKGSTVIVSPKLLTIENLLTKKIKGTIEGPGLESGAKVKIGEKTSNVNIDGTYEIDCEFDHLDKQIEVIENGKDSGLTFNINIDDSESNVIEKNIYLPKVSKMPAKFGTINDVETFIGWGSTGLYARFETAAKTNGFALALSEDSDKGKIILLHTIGTMCITDYYTQKWDYYLPSEFDAIANVFETSRGTTIYEFEIPLSSLKFTSKNLKFIPFEYPLTGDFNYYKDDSGNPYTFGTKAMLLKYPSITANAEISFPQGDVLKSSIEFEAFGKTNATAKFEYYTGVIDYIRVTLNFIKSTGFWGFGVLFGNFDTNAGTTDLFASGYGTVDHRQYGNWVWNGNYVFPSTLGVSLEEKDDGSNSKLTIDYPISALNGTNYNLGISDKMSSLGVQLFEYVTDSSGSLFGCYNPIKIDGVENRFDISIGSSFVPWNINNL